MKFTEEAVDNITIDIQYDMLNPASARSLQLSVLQKEKILEIYTELTSMNTEHIKDMTLTERNIVIERLMMLYRQGKLNKVVDGFDDKMEEIFLTPPSAVYFPNLVRLLLAGILYTVINYIF